MHSVKKWIQEQAQDGRYFFTLEEIRSVFSSAPPQGVSVELLRASKAKLISRAWPGFYLILPPPYVKQGTLPVTMYLDALMSHLDRPYCVALLNAAAFYGAAHQSPQTFTVMTDGRGLRPRMQAGTSLEFISKREFSQRLPLELLRKFKTPTGYIQVSSPEFTALTLIQYAERIGGLSRALSVLEELLEACEFTDICIESMLPYVPLPCFQRLGYMAECLLGEEKHGDALHAGLQALGAKVRKTLLAPSSRNKTGSCNRRWKLVVNVTLESDFA